MSRPRLYRSLQDLLHSINIVAGDGVIDLSDPDEVIIAIAIDNIGFVPRAAISAWQDPSSNEEEELEHAFNLLIDANEATEKEARRYSGFTTTMRPETAVRILMTNRHAMRYVKIRK